jgi:hypothetical protein
VDKQDLTERTAEGEANHCGIIQSKGLSVVCSVQVCSVVVKIGRGYERAGWQTLGGVNLDVVPVVGLFIYAMLGASCVEVANM